MIIQVRYTAGKLRGSDRDFYDFAPRCGPRWQRWLGLKFDTPTDAAVEEHAIAGLFILAWHACAWARELAKA